MVEVGSLKATWSNHSLLKHVHIELVAHDYVKTASEYLKG